MAYFKFTDAILKNKPIEVFNHGKMKRDFTYIDDIIGGIESIILKIPTPDKGWSDDSSKLSKSFSPYQLYNFGNNKPEELTTLIDYLEQYIGKKAIKNYLPIQLNDVYSTYAEIDVQFKPATSLCDGLKKFVNWHLNYYKY